MKRINKHMITLAAIAAFFSIVSAAYAINAVVPASVEITAPTLTLPSPPTAIDFGGVIRGGATLPASIIRMNSAANVASVPAVLGGGSAALDGNGNSGTVTVQSNIGATLNILTTVQGTGSTPAANVLQTFSNETIAFVGTDVANNTPGTLAVVAGAPTVLHVGGQISVANNAVAGSYGANVTVSLNYP